MFYLFLYYNNFSVSLCRFVAFFRETLETLETLCTLFAISVRTFILIPFLLYLFPLSPACSFFHSPTLLKLSLLFYSLFLFCLQKEQPSHFSLYLFYLPCIFFTQNLFQKRYNPCPSRPHPSRAQLLYFAVTA